ALPRRARAARSRRAMRARVARARRRPGRARADPARRRGAGGRERAQGAGRAVRADLGARDGRLGMTSVMTYREALALAMMREMEADPDVFVFGLDVPDHKRIFGSTRGLVEKFGAARCFGTPLSEDAMTGVALG